MSNNSSTSVWPMVVIAGVIGVIVQMISGCGQNNTGTTYTPANTGSVEYRYAKERFKQEGFSSSDADTAARAVLKFHEAQKARGQ